jgi:hypothetical protein
MIDDLLCPRCNTRRLNKSGNVWSGRNMRQRYFCLNCHRVTIVPIVVKKEIGAKLSQGKAPISRNKISGSTQC